MISSTALTSVPPAVLRGASAAATNGQKNEAALALLDQAAQPGSQFTLSEFVEIRSALASFEKDPDGNRLAADKVAGMWAGAVTDLATKRAEGQGAILLVINVPGGGGMAMALTPAGASAALASDDPNALGSITVNGKKTYFRDLVIEALQKAAAVAATEAGKLPPRSRVAQAISEMLERASGEQDEDEPSPTDGRATQLDVEVGKKGEGGRVQLLFFPSRPGDSVPSESGKVLDIAA